ncbi:hypothetical protein BX666DRAFT_2018146 [Dichotomocladium elegans]|nr:hypothetical protein BX666DRAFT_2018146 [Dichotomocladium elegans]
MGATPEQISKIRKQVEFYFSDSNLPYDKFLWTLTKKNSEGWVELKTVASFKRMQKITEDLNTVIEALRSEPSDLFELDEKNENIRRTKELVKRNFVERSIYAKGFPLVDEGENPPKDCLLDLQDKITEYFEQYGRVLAVRLRKTDERPYKFKGSVFVEFSTPEEAVKVAAMNLQYEGQDLLLKLREEYNREKAEKYKDVARDRPKRHQFNAFKLMERSESRGSNDAYPQKKGARGQNKRGHRNHRLITFSNADGVDDDTVKKRKAEDEE